MNKTAIGYISIFITIIIVLVLLLIQSNTCCSKCDEQQDVKENLEPRYLDMIIAAGIVLVIGVVVVVVRRNRAINDPENNIIFENCLPLEEKGDDIHVGDNIPYDESG